jgi:hypothetical protein
MAQDEDSSLEATANAFEGCFKKGDRFRIGCAVCMLLQDQLLSRTQVGLCDLA